MKSITDRLDKIQKVETPPFLYTRIESKINEPTEEIFSFKLLTAMSCMLLVLALANFSLLQDNLLAEHSSESDINILINDISSSNQIYYE